MGSLSKVIPKPLIMIDNLPLIEIIYKYLRQYSINNIFISLNYKKEMIKSFFIEKKFNVNYVVEKKPLGTAGSLSLLDETDIKKGVVCINCDSIFDFDINKAIKFHELNCYDFTIISTEYNCNIPFGVLNIRGSKLLSIGEKPSIKKQLIQGCI